MEEEKLLDIKPSISIMDFLCPQKNSNLRSREHFYDWQCQILSTQTSSLWHSRMLRVYIRWRILKYGNKVRAHIMRLRDNALPGAVPERKVQNVLFVYAARPVAIFYIHMYIFRGGIYINARAHNQATGCPRFYRRRRMKMRLAARSHLLIAINFISTPRSSINRTGRRDEKCACQIPRYTFGISDILKL